MPETAPGTEEPNAYFGGTWVTISHADYGSLIADAGGLEALSVAASNTHPQGRDYVYTAWQLKGSDVPLVASARDGCDPRATRTDCPGIHTFWRFIPWPAYECRPCGNRARMRPAACGASPVHCDECGSVMDEATAPATGLES